MRRDHGVLLAGSQALTHFHPLDLRRARTRLGLALILAIAAWLLVPSRLSIATRSLAAWDTAGLTLLVLGVTIARSSAAETRLRAAARDPGRTLVWILVILASAISLFAATSVVHQSAQLPGYESTLLLALCIGTVVVSWLLTHTVFTLRYAHLYYRAGRDDEGGLEFPGVDKPDDFDFAYFAFTIGMCFQVSDTTVSSQAIRRTVLAHAILSFAYNTVVLALVVNLIVGHAG